MNTGAILQALAACIQPIPGIGQVWPRKRFHVGTDSYRLVWGVEDPYSQRGWSIRAWQWDHERWEAAYLTIDGAVTEWIHHIGLAGWWEINDAQDSTAALQDVLDAIAMTFTDPFLLAEVAVGFAPPQFVRKYEIPIAETYDCHVCEFRMTVRQQHNARADEGSSLNL